MPRKVFGMISTEKSKEYTPPALQTFFAYTQIQPDDEFHLIDNDAGSLNGETVTRDFPSVRFRANAEPRGFAENMNEIMRIAKERSADAYLLNNDLIFTPGWLNPMLIEEPWVLSSVSNAQFQYKTQNLELRLGMRLADFVGKEREFFAIAKKHSETRGGYQMHLSYPFYCVKIPKAVYDKVGFLDETYSKAGFEDADYSVRCWAAGFPLKFATASFVLHFYGKSSWQADSGPLYVDPNPKIGRRGELLFRKRYGEDMTEMFAIQTERGNAMIQQRLQDAAQECFVKIAREAQKYRKSVKNPDTL